MTGDSTRQGRVIASPSRVNSYGALVAVVTALFLAGIAVPFVFGDPVPSSQGDVVAGGPTASTSLDGDDAPAGSTDTTTASSTASSAPGDGSPIDADGGSGAGPGQPGGGSAPPADGAPVRVGFTLVDLGTASDAGFVLSFPSTAQQRGWWDAAVAEVNKTGGLNGRPIQPFYRNVNVLNASDAQQSCVALTEDDKVFAVVGVLYFAVADECVVTGHQTPLFTIGPNDDDTYATGLLATLMPKTSRVIANFGGELRRQGVLDGKRVGILGDSGSDPRGRAMRQMEGLVRAGGAADVRKATLGTDLASAAAQTSVVVNNWRNAGVERVIFIVNPQYAIAFVNNADRQFWQPRYLVSDFASIGNSDIATAGMSSGFDNALSITSTTVNRPPNAALKACLAVLARNGHPVEDPEHAGAAGQQCDMLNMFVKSARAAETPLTKAALTAGIQRAGEVAASRIGGGSFGPRKFDVADLVANARWEYDCACWRPEGAYRRGAA